MFFHNNVATLVLSIVFTSSSMFCLCCCLSLQHDEITTIRIGSRPSKLATIQAKAVASHLQSHHPNIKPILVPIQASGDIVDPSSTSSSTSLPPAIQDVPLAFSNVDFTRTLDDAILEGKIDIAVHSLKDIPPDHRWKSSQKLKIYCPLPREDSHDVLIGPYKTIQELPDGAKVGTSSIRRQAQLLYQCSKQNQNNDMQVEVVNLRGNVETRLSALTNGDVDALILARSGLHRLQMLLSTSDDDDNNNNESNKNIIQCNTIPYNDMLPGTCQGIVAAVVLKGGKFDNNDDDDENDEGIFCWNNNNCIINEESTLMAYAERQFLNILDLATPWKGRPPLAGILEKCSKEEEIEDTTTTYWKFQGLLASTDGKQVISSEKTSMELQQQEQQQQGGEVSIFTKEMAISLGEQVARDILEQAGPHFFDDDGPIKRK